MCDEKQVCDGCGQTMAFDDTLIELNDGMFCTDCVGECADCGEVHNREDMHSIDGRTLCADCVVECHECHETIARDAACEVDGEHYCRECYDDNFVCCGGCEDSVHVDDVHTVREHGRHGRHDVYYCDSCFDERYASCERCGCEVRIDGNGNGDNESYTSEGGDGPYCSECYCEYYTTCDSCSSEISREHCHCNDSGEVFCDDCWQDDNGCAEWPETRVRCGVRFDEIRSRRRFGVELETSDCEGVADIREDTVFGSKHDGSISGKEFVSPPLSGDDGLEHVRQFCKLARNFHVDKRCGYHLHLDMSDETCEGLRRIAYAYAKTQSVWQSFVRRTRRENHYCKALVWGCNDVRYTSAVDGLPGASGRYHWFNLRAYQRHRTFEVRLHTGTLNSDKVCNWIKAHTRFADWASAHSFDEIDAMFSGSADERFAALAEIWDDSELTEYYRGRAGAFGTRYDHTGCADMSLAS